MKQLSIYALALAVILGSVAAGTERVRAFLLPGRKPAVDAMGGEEFVGPFASWTNVKTACGAVGNGTTDDTTAIQSCANGLSSTSPVLYFPAGTYKITSTITVYGHQSIGLVGADPATTSIVWAGSSGGTMLNYENNVSSRVMRLTFDGRGTAGIAAEENWDGIHNYFDQLNEWTDDVFENTTTVAFYCGRTAACSNIPLIRNRFINNSIGVFAGNQNALDINAWYSLFQNNVRGMSNYLLSGPGGGGVFNAFNSVFLENTGVDLTTSNPLYSSFRHNYSNGSEQFYASNDSGATNAAVLQGNMVLDTTNPSAIFLQDRGPEVLLDNAIRNAVGNTTAPVIPFGAGTGDAFSLGNTYTVGTVASDCSGSSPVAVRGGVSGRCHSIQDQVVSTSTFNSTFVTTAPPLPSTPPNLGRTIYEASPSGSGTACSAASPCSIQTAVCEAATGSSGFSAGACTGTVTPSRAVVHLVAGNYSVTSTIAVPASDIQIIADSNSAQLLGSGLAGAPVLKLAGPSKVILRYFLLDGGSHTADGIEIDGADQAGATVFGESNEIGNYSSTGVFSDGLNNTLIEFHELLVFGSGGLGSGVKVVGGGANNGGQTNIFDGDFAGNLISYNVSSDGRLLVEDIFGGDEGEILYTGVSGHHLATVTGSGAFTLSGGLGYNYDLAADPAIAVTNFTGNLAVTSVVVSGNVSITGTGTGANNLIDGVLAGPKSHAVGTVTPGSATLSFGATPPGVASGQWVVDFATPVAIPSSLSSATIVASSTSTTVVMSQDAVGNSGGSGDLINLFPPVPYLDSSGATAGNLNLLTAYNSNSNQDAQQLPESGSSDSGFLGAALAQQRAAKPTLPYDLPTGVTDVRIYGLFLQNNINAIHVVH